MSCLALLLRLWTWFTFRHIRAHFWRTLAVILGIGLGAAVFTSVRLAVSASVYSFSRSMDGIAGKADWSVVCPGKGVPEQLVPKLLGSQGILHASPLMTAYVKVAGDSNLFVLLVGLDPILDRPFRAWQTTTLENGRQPGLWLELMSRPFSVVTGPGLQKHAKIFRGSTLTLEHVQKRVDFHHLGALDPQGLALVDGGEIAVTDIATFQELTGRFNAVDRIDLIMKPGVLASDLAAIRALLPEGVTLERPSETKESGELMIRSYQLNLSVLSFVSLFVGMFLVYSLVALHAKARRPEVAILRSIGASSRLIFLIFLAEGAFFGVLGWVVAIPLGSFLVKGLLASVSSTISHLFVRVRVEELILSPWEILISFVVTAGVCLLAAAQPARQAMLVPPREALVIHEGTTRRRGASLAKTSTAGLILIALVWAISQVPPSMGIPLSGYISTFLLFLGFSLLSPWCLRTTARISCPPLRRFMGEFAYLGGRYVADAGTRVAISVGALITAVGLFVGLVIMIHSFRNTVELWISESVNGDLFLRPKMADINRYRDPMPTQVVESLRRLETPVTLMPYRRIFLHHGKSLYQFEAIDFDVFMDHGKFLFIDGDPERLRKPLMRGEGVLISEVFANQTGLGVGDRFRSRVLGLSFDMPVQGIVRDYRTQGGVVYYSLPRFAEITGDRSWGGVRIFLSEHQGDRELAAARLRGEILRVLGDTASSIEITTGRELHRAIMRIFDETFAVTGVLLVIALAVATLGIASTLTVLVLERTRQLHTLRAVGGSHGQLRMMILWEAILMVFVGEMIGLACGFLLSRLLIFVVNRQSFGWTFIYGVDWASIILSLPLILTTALAAALPAGRAVFRMSPAEALKES